MAAIMAVAFCPQGIFAGKPQDAEVSKNRETRKKKTEKGESGRILFYDDFSAPELDAAKWSIHFRRDAEGVSIEDGNLIIRLLKVGEEYKAGGITTKDKFAIQYGKIEVRSRFVRDLSSGELPAIWMMPVPGTCKYVESNPGGGEIDIMERVKRENVIHQTCHSAYTTGEPNLGVTRNGGNTVQIPIEGEVFDWHVYGFENTPDELRFYFDGELTFTYRKMENADELYQWPYDVPFYLNINTAIGAEGKWPGPLPEDDSELPAEMAVDWVKITANEYTTSDNYYE